MHITVDESVSIVSMNDGHAAVLLELVNANRPHLRQWLSWVDHMQHEGHFLHFISQCQKKEAAGTDFAYLILYNGIVAGRIGLYNIDQQNKIGAIGYWLGQAFSGKGIVHRACVALTNFSFTTPDINRIELKCGTGNFKSQAVAERLGFKKEGIIHRGELLYNQFIDLHLYAMLKTEWEDERATPRFIHGHSC
jgi:ribosomal-protein-serine acetyltransferase